MRIFIACVKFFPVALGPPKPGGKCVLYADINGITLVFKVVTCRRTYPWWYGTLKSLIFGWRKKCAAPWIASVWIPWKRAICCLGLTCMFCTVGQVMTPASIRNIWKQGSWLLWPTVPDVSDAPLYFVLGNSLTNAMWVAYHRCLRTVLVQRLLGDKKFVVKVR